MRKSTWIMDKGLVFIEIGRAMLVELDHLNALPYLRVLPEVNIGVIL